MDEHQRILGRLDRLAELVGSTAVSADRSGDAQLQEIHEVSGQLIGAEPHHQREEQVLFPVLSALGIEGPPRMMELEHVELRRLKHSVREKSECMLSRSEDCWRELVRDALELVSMLRSHIHKEDQILYPMAFEEIAVESWVPMKARCDEIGYCCHGPSSSVGT
jgi:hemerythrin-like domain-containing protein